MNDKTTCCVNNNCAPKEKASFDKILPSNKELTPQWRKSLFERGESEVYEGEDLKYIGMPVGGICTGQVYLGGDGQLWHWDIFKDYGGAEEHADPTGPHYMSPLQPKSPIKQGFAIKHNDKVLPLNKQGFSNVSFHGTYPIGHVTYNDDTLPFKVKLRAFSPFIPLDAKNSGLPLTVLEYTVVNESEDELEVSLLGWLENKVAPYLGGPLDGERKNTISTIQNKAILTTETLVSNGAAGSGSMSVCVLDNGEKNTASAVVDDIDAVTFAKSFEQGIEAKLTKGREELLGGVKSTVTIKPKSSHTFVAVIAWYYPEYTGGDVFFAKLGEESFYSTMDMIDGLTDKKRFYASFLNSSEEVVDYFVEHQSYLSNTTKEWVDTWYGANLPPWILNRTFLNISTLATGTCHRFDDGRVWAWEGVDSCPGTCQHVWQYAQSVAHIFPELERALRESVDYGIAYYEDGSLDYRAEASQFGPPAEAPPSLAKFAADGQLGTIIRVYREHRKSTSEDFLMRIWPKVKHSMQFMMQFDRDKKGIIQGPQYNTLDVTWHGKIPWISSLYLAALAASKEMAKEMGDEAFSNLCDELLKQGQVSFVNELYNGEYFVHRADPERKESMNLMEASYIDQVLGQSFAFQVGLDRILPEPETCSALKAIWKYNYTQNVGLYRENFKGILGGRWYAEASEGGTIMCTWPKEDCVENDPIALAKDITSDGYLNECMAGFEYQVASHMIAEGMVTEGLSLTKSIHDRYHPSKRNPWNEVECGDHYSRSMASFGVFISLCGFEYHGPKGVLAFSPKIQIENFKSAFLGAQGWGSYQQRRLNQDHQEVLLDIVYGELKLKQFTFPNLLDSEQLDISLELAGSTIKPNFKLNGKNISLHENIFLKRNTVLRFCIRRLDNV